MATVKPTVVSLERNDQQKWISYSIQVSYQVVSETIKIVAAKIFLEFLGKRFLTDTSRIPAREIYLSVVFAPVIEEIICRGVLLGGTRVIQKGWNHLRGNQLSEKDKRIQQQFRIHLSSLIFGALHLLVPHQSATRALFHCVSAYCGGVVYGYLSEKYQTLSFSILCHGFHNFFAVGQEIYPSYSETFVLAVMINKIGAYVLATTTIDTKIASAIRQTAAFSLALPRRLMMGRGENVNTPSKLETGTRINVLV